MAPHELLVHAAGHLREVACPSLLQQEREEVDLEEQVAELVEELLVVAGERGVRDLVRLLDRVRDDRRRGLLAIPGALAAQALRQLPAELEEGLVQRGPPRQPVVVGAGVVGVVVEVVAGGVARLVRDLALEVLRHLREPRRPGRLLLLRSEVRLDLRLDLGEGLGVGGLDRAERLDDVVAVDALHRLRDLVRLERERGLVERRDRLLAGAARAAVGDAELAALGR